MDKFESHDGVIILDGGLGTTLETHFALDITSPLWSTHALLHAPDKVYAAHKAFLEAGSDMILTATYQSSQVSLAKAGLSPEEGEKTLASAIEIARQATIDWQRTSGRKAAVTLSLGPYAACLSPTQEYSGAYPPPYGPEPGIGTAFEDSEKGRIQEKIAIEQLTRFHLGQIRQFLGNGRFRDSIDCLAFETVPLAREVTAIRRAVAQWETDTNQPIGIPWWISFVLPEGHSSETDWTTGVHLSAETMAQVAWREQDGQATPDAIGINCTSANFLRQAFSQMTEAIHSIVTKTGKRPWFVMYPNSGETYQGEGVWTGGDRVNEWQQDVIQALDEVDGSVWAGTIVGGCCRTGPQDIQDLVHLCNQRFLGRRTQINTREKEEV